ncbi:metal-dependent phosphohydrolase [Methylobacterium sp. D54C]
MQLVLPPLRRTAADAALFAAALHERGQKGQIETPLMAHLARVAAIVTRLGEGCPFWNSEHRDDAVQVAWLHHAIEGGEITVRMLMREGFSRIVAEEVEVLSAPKESSLSEWIDDSAERAGLMALLVKLADVIDKRSLTQVAARSSSSDDAPVIDLERLTNRLIEAVRRKGWEGDCEVLSRMH